MLASDLVEHLVMLVVVFNCFKRSYDIKRSVGQRYGFAASNNKGQLRIVVKVPGMLDRPRIDVHTGHAPGNRRKQGRAISLTRGYVQNRFAGNQIQT